MKSIFLHVPYHSIVDLITNSSSELFVFKGEPKDETAKILLEFITSKSLNESSVVKFSDYKYKDDLILPEGVDPECVYVANIDYNESILEELLQEVFETIEVEWK